MDKIIVNFTPTGMIPTKKMTPLVPVTNNEIIEDVRKATRLGISMVHLHCRDPITQAPDYHKENYAEIIRGIRSFAPDLIICVSTSGRTEGEFSKRAEVLLLDNDEKPDMASLTLSSLNFNNQASMNEPSMIVQLAETMKVRGIKPELEAFDAGMINYAKYLIRKDLLIPPYYFNLILGNIACAQADLLHAGLMVNDVPSQSVCSFGGVGDYQLRVNSLATAMGYGIRIGLEDNIWFDEDRTKPASNSDLLERALSFAALSGREVMSSGELRALLGLKKGYGQYGSAEE